MSDKANEIMNELADMANFKGFGETGEKMCENCEACICKSCAQVAWLEQENARLKSCLQEIKTITERLLEKGLEPQSVEHQLRLRSKRELASIISDLITKAEEE